MKELPDSTKDRSVIRLTRNRHNGMRPFDSRGDHDFVRRFMDNYWQDTLKVFVSEKWENEKTTNMYRDKLNNDQKNEYDKLDDRGKKELFELEFELNVNKQKESTSPKKNIL